MLNMHNEMWGMLMNVYLPGDAAQVIPPAPSLFTLLRPYLAHFFPEKSRFLRVFTAWPRRFQRAASRNPGPRNGGKSTKRRFLCSITFRSSLSTVHTCVRLTAFPLLLELVSDPDSSCLCPADASGDVYV